MFSVHPEPGHRDPCIGPTRTGCNRCAPGRSLTETPQRSGVATPRIWVNPTNGAGNSSLYHGNNTDLVIFTRKRRGSTSTTLDSSNGQMTATNPCAPGPYGLARIRPPQGFPHPFPTLLATIITGEAFVRTLRRPVPITSPSWRCGHPMLCIPTCRRSSRPAPKTGAYGSHPAGPSVAEPGHAGSVLPPRPILPGASLLRA